MKYRVSSLSATGGDGRSPVGFIKAKESYEVVTPYGFILSESVERSDRGDFDALKKYAHCIKKALRKDLVKAKLEDNVGGKANPIAALHIIIDFLENGVYREFEHENKRSERGKINFKKTIKHVVPSIIGNELFYPNFIVSRKKVSEQSDVALAQANIINHFMDNGGEVLFGNRIHIKIESVSLDESLIRKLNKIRANSYNSRKQQLIRWMTEYIRGAILDKETKGDWLFSIVASTLWEEMIDACFSNQKIRDKTVYGKREKAFRGGKMVTVGAPTQHDTLYETDDEIIIFDAKMYGSKSGIENGDVLGKQHGYYRQARLRNPEKLISNILVLPFIEHTDSVPGFQRDFYPDYDHGDPNDIILVYEIDFKTVMEAYYRGKRLVRECKEELHAFLKSAEYKSDREASWARR